MHQGLSPLGLDGLGGLRVPPRVRVLPLIRPANTTVQSGQKGSKLVKMVKMVKKDQKWSDDVIKAPRTKTVVKVPSNASGQKKWSKKVVKKVVKSKSGDCKCTTKNGGRKPTRLCFLFKRERLLTTGKWSKGSSQNTPAKRQRSKKGLKWSNRSGQKVRQWSNGQTEVVKRQSKDRISSSTEASGLDYQQQKRR